MSYRLFITLFLYFAITKTMLSVPSNGTNNTVFLKEIQINFKIPTRLQPENNGNAHIYAPNLTKILMITILKLYLRCN